MQHKKPRRKTEKINKRNTYVIRYYLKSKYKRNTKYLKSNKNNRNKTKKGGWFRKKLETAVNRASKYSSDLSPNTPPLPSTLSESKPIKRNNRKIINIMGNNHKNEEFYNINNNYYHIAENKKKLDQNREFNDYIQQLSETPQLYELSEKSQENDLESPILFYMTFTKWTNIIEDFNIYIPTYKIFILSKVAYEYYKELLKEIVTLRKKKNDLPSNNVFEIVFSQIKSISYNPIFEEPESDITNFFIIAFLCIYTTQSNDDFILRCLEIYYKKKKYKKESNENPTTNTNNNIIQLETNDNDIQHYNIGYRKQLNIIKILLNILSNSHDLLEYIHSQYHTPEYINKKR